MDMRTPLDRSAIVRLFNLGGKKLVTQMVELFFRETPKRLETARNGKDKGDLDAIERVTHSLKTSSANVGSKEMSRLSGLIEQCAYEKKMEEIPELLRMLEEEYVFVKKDLEEELGKL